MKMKDVATIVSVIIIGALLVVIWNLKQTNDMTKYAMENNCEWVATGTMYGDNRDFVCVLK